MWPVNQSIFTKADFAPSLKFSVIPTMPETFPPMIASSPSAVMTSDEDYHTEDTGDDKNTPSMTAVGDNPFEDQDLLENFPPSAPLLNIDDGSNITLEKTPTPVVHPLTRSELQRINDLNQQAFNLHNPSSKMAAILDENSCLKARIYALEAERDLYKGQAEAYHAHCCMSRWENEKLHWELEEKKKKKPKHKINTLAWVLTCPEGEAEWREKTRLAEEAEAAEALKQKNKSAAIEAHEIQRYKESDTKIFEHTLRNYTRKDDIQDIAAAFGLPWKEGTIPELLTHIKAHMEANPSLKSDTRFANLFNT